MRLLQELKRKWKSEELVLCVSLLQARTADIPFAAAASGADALYVDLEHGVTSLETAALLCSAALGAGIPPLVRIPAGEYALAARALDAGAAGLLLPHTDSASQLEAAVKNFRFAPLGTRSFGGFAMPTSYHSMPAARMLDGLNQNTSILAMIETPAGVENADEIAAVDGVDVLIVGTNDLCIELEIPGDLRNPRLKDAIQKVASACKRHGKVLGIGGIRNDLDHFEEVIKIGARFLIVGSDIGYVATGIRNDVQLITRLKRNNGKKQ